MKLVIIGYGPGGVAAATAARAFDSTAEIVIYTGETLDAHRKPGASLALEHPDTKDLAIPDWSFKSLSEKRIEVVSGVQVVDADVSAKSLSVKSKDGKLSNAAFDKLVVATGGTPYVPSIPGIELEGVFTIQDMADTTLIGNKLSGMNNIVVIGAGFSGLEIAERLLHLDKEVHMIVRSRLMRRQLEGPMSEELTSRLPSNLIIHQGSSPTKVLGEKHATGIELNGSLLEADAILFMTGVRPNVELGKKLNLKVGELGGLEVSETLETSIEGIYAVGDCVEMHDTLTGKPVLMPIGSVAARAGKQAGVTAVGGRKIYDDTSLLFQYDRILGTDIVCIGNSSITAKQSGIKTSVTYLEDPFEYSKVALVTTSEGKLIGGQVLASRLGARIGYQILDRVEKGTTLKDSPLLAPQHERMKDLLEKTLGPIQ